MIDYASRESIELRRAITVPEYWRRSAWALDQSYETWAEGARLCCESEKSFRCRAMEAHAAHSWMKAGAVRYAPARSLVEMLILTSGRGVDWGRLPHPTFLIEFPRDLLPFPATPGSISPPGPSWVGVHRWESRSTGLLLCIVDADSDAVPMTIPFDMVVDEDEADACVGRNANNTFPDPPAEEVAPDMRYPWRLVVRLVGNLVDYIAEFPGGVDSGRASSKQTVSAVRLPRDVQVTAEMKAAALRVASAGDMPSLRRAMEHVVRGHWRMQPCGRGRSEIRRTWVRPHKRGDAALGRVIERAMTVGVVQ